MKTYNDFKDFVKESCKPTPFNWTGSVDKFEELIFYSAKEKDVKFVETLDAWYCFYNNEWRRISF
jgi:hypothetical protein